MELKNIHVSQADIDDILQEATPGTAASFTGDACSVFHQARPTLLTATAILSFIYPPAATAIGALVAILDKACKA